MTDLERLRRLAREGDDGDVRAWVWAYMLDRVKSPWRNTKIEVDGEPTRVLDSLGLALCKPRTIMRGRVPLLWSQIQLAAVKRDLLTRYPGAANGYTHRRHVGKGWQDRISPFGVAQIAHTLMERQAHRTSPRMMDIERRWVSQMIWAHLLGQRHTLPDGYADPLRSESHAAAMMYARQYWESRTDEPWPL